MRAAARIGLVVCSLLFLAGLICVGLAIWTVGPDSGRWAGTAAMLLIVGFWGGFGSAAAIDLGSDR